MMPPILFDGLAPIPYSQIRLVAEGFSTYAVIHVPSGTRIGKVVKWPDGGWFGYTAHPRGNDETINHEGTRRRIDSVYEVCEPCNHVPVWLSVRDGNGHKRDATEEECRERDPESWAWWDTVRPLFPVWTDDETTPTPAKES